MHVLSRLWTWLKWPIALGALAYLVIQHREEFAQLSQQPKDIPLLVLAFLLCAGSTLLTFLRWYLLVTAQEFPFRVGDALRLGFLGLMFNYVAPGAVGGDLIKAWMLAREQRSRRSVAVATVFLDRILGLLALFAVGTVATLCYGDVLDTPELRGATLMIWVGTAGGIVGLIAMLHPAIIRWRWIQAFTRLPKVGHLIGDLLHGVALYQAKQGIVFAAVMLSVLGHAGLIAGFYCGALALRQPEIPSLGLHYYLMPIAELFGVLVPVPGGVGALEAAIQWFYQQLLAGKLSPEKAGGIGLFAAIVFRLVQLTIAGVGTGYYLASKREIKAVLAEAAAEDETPSMTSLHASPFG